MQKTFENIIIEALDDEIQTADSIMDKLSRCSDELKTVKTEEEFDNIINKYSLLNTKFTKDGLYPGDFSKIVDKYKEKLNLKAS